MGFIFFLFFRLTLDTCHLDLEGCYFGLLGGLIWWLGGWFAGGVDLVFVDLDYHHLLFWSDLGLVGDFFVVSSTIFVEVLPGAELFPFSIHLGV